ncbi:hypothetical protein OIU74_009250 [Salix koriyanagi]|uniref:Secreted protein n=1 Tax=Salix koriyanagi TaxID=2511006 RepID=A0A9Q0Z0B3_9ROSI|nr:hypothetical protein OIU74_009250 [Salix koriyanagi]
MMKFRYGLSLLNLIFPCAFNSQHYCEIFREGASFLSRCLLEFPKAKIDYRYYLLFSKNKSSEAIYSVTVYTGCFFFVN